MIQEELIISLLWYSVCRLYPGSGVNKRPRNPRAYYISYVDLGKHANDVGSQAVQWAIEFKINFPVPISLTVRIECY